MALLTPIVGIPSLPVRGISAQRPRGETISYQNLNSVLFRTRHPIGVSLRVQPFRSRRLVANASQFVCAESVLLWPRVVLKPFQSRTIMGASQMGSSLTICASAYTAVAETQTVPRRSSTSNSAPGKESLPLLDNGGGFGGSNVNFKPYYRGDDSGAGGGAGGGGFSSTGEFPWGDFWFFIFLFLLRFLFTQIIGEGFFNFKHDTGKNKPIQRYL